jgi:hypothetical protein
MNPSEKPISLDAATAADAGHILSPEEMAILNREFAHFMHGWVRDVAASRVQRKRKGAIAMLEAFISSATGNPYPKVDDYVVSYHANFDRGRTANKYIQS